MEMWAANVVGNVGSNTSKRYQVSLRQVDQILSGCFVDEIDRAKIAELIRFRRTNGERKITNATIRRDLVAVSSVLSFCEDEGLVQGNPALAIMKKLKERRDPIVLPSSADIEYVAGRAPGLFRAMILAAWRTGCRQEELASLERKRVDLRRWQLTVIGKGNKLRTIDMHRSAEIFRSIAVHLKSQIVFWHGSGIPYGNVSSRFAEMTAAAQRAAQKAGREFQRFRFHDLRHRFAVDYLKDGLGSLHDLQLHLGHRSVKTTEIYLQYLTPEEARSAKATVAQTAAHQ